jgi:hypothetical protein
MSPEEQETYANNYNKRLEEILEEVEEECEWTHNPSLTKETDTVTTYSCYPIQHFARKKPVPRHEFAKAVNDRFGRERVSTTYPMTINRPEDWYVLVTIKKV